MTRTVQVIAGTNVSIASNWELPNIYRIEGYCNGTVNTQYFLQLHNLAFGSLVSGVSGSVPIRSWQILGQDGFTFSFADECLSTSTLPTMLNSTNPNLIVVLSSTDATYTTPGITADINVDLEEYNEEIAGTTSQSNYAISPVGNLSLVLVADTLNNTNKLVFLDITETGGVASWIMLFASSTNLTTPVRSIPLPANANVKLHFGDSDNLTQQDANGTNHYGIIISISTTGNTLTVGHATINKATYL